MQTASDTQRRVCCLGLIKLFNSDDALTGPYLSLWPSFATGVLKCMEIRTAQNTNAVEDEPYLLDVEEAGYQAGFVKLSAIAKKSVDAATGVNVSDAFKQCLARPQQSVFAELDQETRNKLNTLF